MTDGRTTPWLQDVDANNNQLSDIWTEQWDVVYRDVIIVDEDLTELGAFNLTTYNLADPDTYTALRDILVGVATDVPFWRNATNPLDVNNDGTISAQGDVLAGINEINNQTLAISPGQLPYLRLPVHANSPYLDVNGDGLVTAQADILPIINAINTGGSAEGESSLVSAMVESLGEPIEHAAPNPFNFVADVSSRRAPEAASQDTDVSSKLAVPHVTVPNRSEPLLDDVALDMTRTASDEPTIKDAPTAPADDFGDDDFGDLEQLTSLLAADVASVWSAR